MTAKIHANVSFSVPEEALREGEGTFKEEMKENIEFWFEIPVVVTVDVKEDGEDADGEPTKRADIDLEFTVDGEEQLDLGDETVEDVLRNDLDSFFSVPVSTTIERLE